MTDNQFDNFIRSSLKDHSAPVPAGLWDKVRPTDKDDRKGGFFRRFGRFGFVSLAGLLVAVAVTGYLYFTATPNNIADNTQNNTEQQAVLQQRIVPTPTNTTNDNHNNSDRNNNLTIGAGTAVSVPENMPALEPAHSKPTGKTNQRNQAPLRTNNDLITNSINTGTAPAIPFVPKTVVAENSNTSIEADENKTPTTYLTPYQSNFFTANTIASRSNMFSLSNLQNLQLANAASHTRKIIICPTTSGRGNSDWNIEVYASPDIAFKSITNRNATAQYLQTKDSSESMRVGYTAGFRIVKPITDHILLKTGLQFSQVNELFRYRTQNEIKTTTVVTVRTIIRAPGDTVIVSDTSTLQQIGYRTNTIHNRYRSIDVPLTVGYQFGNDDNITVGINAGVIFNLTSWYQGVILDTALAAVPSSKGTNMLYKSNIGLGLYGGISIMKRIGDNTHVFVEPYFRYNLSNMTNDQATYNQRFSIGGLSVGLRYNLNNR